VSPRGRVLTHLREHARRHEQQLVPAPAAPGAATTFVATHFIGYGSAVPAPSAPAGLPK